VNRDQLIRALRKYAKRNQMFFEVDVNKGKGSHYRVKLGSIVTTIQQDLNPSRIQRILKQLNIESL
jgi:hypothetical protein